MENYYPIEHISSCTRGNVYRVKNMLTGECEIMKLTENISEIDIYDAIRKYNTKYFVVPKKIIYTDDYPKIFMGIDCVQKDDTESWIIYTMPEYTEVNIGKDIPPQERKSLFVNILKEYSLLQKKLGFVQGGDLGGNIMKRENDLVVIDLDDSYFTRDKNAQFDDSVDIIETFEFDSNTDDLKLLLSILKKLHSSKWYKYI